MGLEYVDLVPFGDILLRHSTTVSVKNALYVLDTDGRAHHCFKVVS